MKRSRMTEQQGKREGGKEPPSRSINCLSGAKRLFRHAETPRSGCFGAFARSVSLRNPSFPRGVRGRRQAFDACADLVEEADDDKHGADHGHDRARDLQDAFDGFHISALLFFLQYKPVFSILQGV